MIGYAKIDKEALKQWADNEKESITKAEDKRSACWYDSLWSSYFYHRQDVFKDAKPLIEIRRSSFSNSLDDRSQEFMALIDNLESEGQRLAAFYADDTAVIVGYQDHKYILPAHLVEVVPLRDYSLLTSKELAVLGDTQMSEAMLPADVSGCSVQSLEDELNDKKHQIDDAKAKCEQAIEEIRNEAMRKEKELRELLEKETEKLEVMKEELENKIFVLDTQIYGIRCYLGEVIDFKQIRAGKASSSDTPVVMFQKIRFLDEEMGKYLSLYTFGQYEDDNETLIGALKTRDDLRDVFCPTDRCITVLRNSRTGKAIKSSDKFANMLEKYDYLHGKQIAILVRDGENLYIGWTDEERINISSEDMFLRPGKATIKEVEDIEYGFGHKYWDEKDRAKKEKEAEKRAATERMSRYFLISVLQGMIDRGGLINIPQNTRITEESDLVKFSFAEGWLKDNTYGTFKDILDRSKDIEVKKGEIVLTGMHVTRDDVNDYTNRWNSEYAAYSNNRGIGEKNRTHGVSVPGFEFMPINKVLKSVTVEVSFDIIKATAVVNNQYTFRADNAKAWDVVKDPSGELLGSYTKEIHLSKEDFNSAGTLTNYEKVVMAKFNNRPFGSIDKETGEIHCSAAPCATRHEWLSVLDDCGFLEIKDIQVLADEEQYTFISVPMETWNDSGARVNFEIMPDEYVRTTYLCSTWLKYAITTGNIGDFRICGTRMSYAGSLKYLNKLIEHVREREETEKMLLLKAGGKEYVESHSDWDRELCEWRIANQIANLTSRSALSFLKAKARGITA